MTEKTYKIKCLSCNAEYVIPEELAEKMKAAPTTMQVWCQGAKDDTGKRSGCGEHGSLKSGQTKNDIVGWKQVGKTLAEPIYANQNWTLTETPKK